MKYLEARKSILNIAKKLMEKSFVTASEGNFSVRVDDELVAITPSMIPYEVMGLEDIVILDLDGNIVEGSRKPTSEKHLHLYIYRERDDVNAVLHTHPIYVSAVSVIGESIPVIIEEQYLYVGGEIPIAEYGITGTEDLAKKAVKALGSKRAVILRNHGLVTVGDNLDDAFNVTMVVEKIARIFLLAKMVGKVNEVPDWGKKILEEKFL